GVGEEVMDKWIVEPELELATPEQAARRGGLVAEAGGLRADISGKALAGGCGVAAGGGWTAAGADPLLGEERGDDHEEDRPFPSRLGGDPRQGHLHGDAQRLAPADHGPAAAQRF